jgi:hypothetical protein
MLPQPVSPPEVKDWQTLYTAEKAHWQDLNRSSHIQTPSTVKVLCIFLYMAALIPVFLYINGWTPQLGWNRDTLLLAIAIIAAALIPLYFSSLWHAYLSRLVEDFFRAFYKPSEDFESKDIKRLIKNRVEGIPPASALLQLFNSSMEYPYVVIPEDGQIKPEQKWVKWLGGPANLVINDGIAVYLERGNKFSRVVGSGIVFLERFETVRAIVQLTPQKKEVDLHASTKDGIPISLRARIVFQVGVNPIAHSTPDNRLYPLDPLAIKNAVEKTTLRYRANGNYEESHWYDSIWGQINGPLMKYITCHVLNEFFVTDADKENTLPDLVQKKLFNEVRPKLESFGVKLLELQITEIKPPEEVDQQRLQNWEAMRQSRAVIREGESKAYQLRMTETARAIAQRDLILAIAEGLDKMDQDHLDEQLLLSLSAMLDQSLSDSYTRSLIASDTLETLENLKKLI